MQYLIKRPGSANITWCITQPYPRFILFRCFYRHPTRSGTEENNELCSHIPGPACSRRSGNEEAGPGEGFVHVHRGFYGIGGDLSADEYGWTNPVAEVFIDKPTSV